MDSNNNIGSKKAMKLLLSVSAFSIMLSFSSLLFPFLINSLFNVYVSAFSKRSFSSALEKNCVFLLCNGLLVIIVKNSGLIGKSPRLDTSNGNIVLKSSPEKEPTPALQQVVSEDEEEEEEEDNGEKNGRDQLVTLEREKETKEEQELELATELDENEEVENGIIIFEDDYENSEEEEAFGLPSTEEFNKKCEDFIRRVKEEIKFGGR